MTCPAPPSANESFAERWSGLRSQGRLLVLGADPSESILDQWDLPKDPDGIERFVDVILDVVPYGVGVIKPQSAFFEAYGWKGMRALGRLIRETREMGSLVLLDAKRGDIGTTADAYGAAFFGEGSGFGVDALTIAPYLGLNALRPLVNRAYSAGGAVFVVARSSNPEGREVQTAVLRNGLSVERGLLREIGAMNDQYRSGVVNAVVGVHSPTFDRDELRSANALFLCPGFGAQGTTSREIAESFAAVPDRVLPTASRSVLEAGPNAQAVAERWVSLNAEVAGALATA